MNEIRSFVLRHRHLVILVVVTIGGFVVTSSLLGPSQGGSPNGFSLGLSNPSRGPTSPALGADMGARGGFEPQAETDTADGTGRVTERSYSIPLHELSGLPSDLAPGASIELWVAWRRPFTRGPRVQRLLRNATFERVAPPATVEGSPVAVLSIPRKRIVDVVFADQYGSISVATY